jgi:hypothetical protein
MFTWPQTLAPRLTLIVSRASLSLVIALLATFRVVTAFFLSWADPTSVEWA